MAACSAKYYQGPCQTLGLAEQPEKVVGEPEEVAECMCLHSKHIRLSSLVHVVCFTWCNDSDPQ